MKALVLHGPNQPFSLETVPDPEPGPGEVVARVIACGAGLTIQHVKAGRRKIPFPRIIGHEIAGEVVALGSGVGDFKVGDPVTAYYYLTCGHCRWCRIDRENLCENRPGQVGQVIDGGYAEFIKLPVRNAIKLPEGLDYKTHPEAVGVISDAIATPWKVLRRARVGPMDTVAVFGAGGGLGIHMLMMARWAHARTIAVDIRPEKFDACRKAGADEVVDAGRNDAVEALVELTGGRGVDVAIEFAGTESALSAAVRCLGAGGRLVTLAGSHELRIDSGFIRDREIDLLGSRYCTRQELMDSLAICARGDVWPMITEVADMNGAEALHDRIERGEVTGRAALRIAD